MYGKDMKIKVIDCFVSTETKDTFNSSENFLFHCVVNCLRVTSFFPIQVEPQKYSRSYSSPNLKFHRVLIISMKT